MTPRPGLYIGEGLTPRLRMGVCAAVSIQTWMSWCRCCSAITIGKITSWRWGSNGTAWRQSEDAGFWGDGITFTTQCRGRGEVFYLFIKSPLVNVALRDKHGERTDQGDCSHIYNLHIQLKHWQEALKGEGGIKLTTELTSIQKQNRQISTQRAQWGSSRLLAGRGGEGR